MRKRQELHYAMPSLVIAVLAQKQAATVCYKGNAVISLHKLQPTLTYHVFLQDNAATMKVQLDAQKKATDQLVSNTRCKSATELSSSEVKLNRLCHLREQSDEDKNN